MNKAKSRQHSRKAPRRAALRLKRGQKANAKKVDRSRRLIKGSAFSHSSKGDTPSDTQRAYRRAGKRKAFVEKQNLS